MNQDNVNIAKDKMQKALEHFREELAGIRTGRANPSLLEGIKVDAYGQKMDLRDLASINAPEPGLLVVQVWDPANLASAEKAIRDSSQGLNPVNDGQVLRVPIPPLSEERRKEMTKLVTEKAEGARVTIRQLRREIVEEIDKAEKAKELSEDEKFRFREQVQKITDEMSSHLEEMANAKDKEILQI